MAFGDSGDQQIRLRFSRYTNTVIENDCFQFGNIKKNTFINTVISNYYETADASIHMRLSEYKASLMNHLPIRVNKSASKHLIKGLVEAEKQRLLALACSYEAPDKYEKSKPYRLQNELYQTFVDSSDDFHQELYYNNSWSAYLRTLIEEYAHLPYYKREYIFFKSYFETIETAIAQKKQLLITNSKGENYHTLPYKILSDPLSTAHYLTGFSYHLSGSKENKYCVSYKISMIKKLRIEKSKSAYLHPKDISLINDELSNKGVQFLISDYEEIKVRFSEKGLQSYNKMLHLRPPANKEIIKDNNHYIVTFHCSLYQATAYFFKFGSDAEILSPKPLRDMFLNKYKNAVIQYCSPK